MRFLSSIFVTTALIASTSWAEEEMTVDQADSLDFSSFHQASKKEQKRSISDIFGDSSNATDQSLQLDINDEALIVQQQYSLDTSTKNNNPAFAAINSLHQQMAKQCPKGWVKKGEWVTLVEDGLQQHYQLHYQFHCLL